MPVLFSRPAAASVLATGRSRSLCLTVRAALRTQTKAKTTSTKAPSTSFFKTSSSTLKDTSAGKQKPLTFGFTKDNELFVGRLAMMGFAFSLIGEVLTGKGALAQLGYEVFNDKLGIIQIDEIIVGLIAFNLVAALLPTSGTFVADSDGEERPEGPLQNPKITVFDPKRFFGVSGFGFTKENELFVGRMAQLGFAASLIGETITGKGALAQFDIETGISLRDTEAGLVVFILFFLFAAVNPGTGKFVYDESKK